MAQKDWIDEYIQEVIKCQELLKTIQGDAPGLKVQRIQVLSKMLVFIGKLATEFTDRHKRMYIARKKVHAQAYIDAPNNKAARAELAIADIREQEADAFKYMKRWNTAFEVTKEEINALKYSVKMDFEDGSSRGK